MISEKSDDTVLNYNTKAMKLLNKGELNASFDLLKKAENIIITNPSNISNRLLGVT